MKLSKRAKRTKNGCIIVDEGDDHKIMAYKFRHPTNIHSIKTGLSKKQLQSASIIEDVPVSKFFGDPFTFVVVCWQHPNYGYFADACFFWKSMHGNSWNFVPVAGWTNQYDKHHVNVEQRNPVKDALDIVAGKSLEETFPTCVRLFLEDYPEFKELFE